MIRGPNKNWSNSISFIDETFCNFKWAEIWESTGRLERVPYKRIGLCGNLAGPSEPEIPNETGWKHFEPYYRKHEWILGSTKNHLWSNPCLEKKGFSSSPKSWMLLDKLGFIKDLIKSILIEGKQTRSIVTYLCHFRSTIVVDSGILILVLCIEVSFIFRSIWAEWTNRSAFCEAVVHKSNTRK